ncbi:unnamed protein product, partial [Rotaria sordida]
MASSYSSAVNKVYDCTQNKSIEQNRIAVSNNDKNIRQYNISEIDLSQSPEDDRCPRFFQPKGLVRMENDSDTPDEDDCFKNHDLKIAALEMERAHFTKIITATQQNNDFDSTNVSDDDDHRIISQAIIKKLDHAFESTKLAINTEAIEARSNPNMSNHYRPYPPVERTGIIHDHDRPFAEYGHLDATSISQNANFDWNGMKNDHRRETTKKRMQRKSWAITSWSDVPRVHCNYQVTHNDIAWNEYCKKGGDFIEFGEFKSPSSRGSKYWPDLPSNLLNTSSGSSSSLNDIHNEMPRQKSVRNIAEERRQRKIITAERALLLAQTDVTKAMNLVREAMPLEFMTHSSWYENAAMNRWIRHHFSRKSRAKCLVLIGPTGTGKTSFALSLPGTVNYFKGRWNLDNWNPMARYSIYDDIGWDNFEKMNYPSKKDLLTQNGLTGVTDKITVFSMYDFYSKDEGSLTAEPQTKDAEEEAEYWKKRAYIYRMKPGEYFYKRRQRHGSDSSNSSIGSNEERIGDPNEFINAERCWLQQQKLRIVAHEHL